MLFLEFFHYDLFLIVYLKEIEQAKIAYKLQFSLMTITIVNLDPQVNKPKGLKVAKEELRLIGSMVDSLYGR